MSEYEIVPAPQVSLGSLATSGPVELIERASGIAKALAEIIDSRELFVKIGRRKHVYVEGWTTLGAMLGVLPVEDYARKLEDGSFEAAVNLIRVSDGAIIGRGSALCGMDEKTWAGRDAYARRSMAITRAMGKAYRSAFSWIITLAGYAPTPAEEMPTEQATRRAPKAQKATRTAATTERKANGKGPAFIASTLQAVIEAGHAENIPQAARRLGKSKKLNSNDAPDIVIGWAATYDAACKGGKSPDEAAAHADDGFIVPGAPENSEDVPSAETERDQALPAEPVTRGKDKLFKAVK